MWQPRNAKCRDCVRQGRLEAEDGQKLPVLRCRKRSRESRLRSGLQGTEPRAQDRYLRGLNLRALVKDQAQPPSMEINQGTLSTRLLFSQRPNDLLLVIESAAAANLHHPSSAVG